MKASLRGAAATLSWSLTPPKLVQGVLHVVGLGLRLPAQLTMECAAALLAAERIHCLEPRSLYGDALAPLLDRIVDHSALFQAYPQREDALREAARRAADDAMASAGVVFALGGHPSLAVSPFLHLVELADEKGLRLRTLPGISSVATFIAELGIDPCGQGMQLVRGRSAKSLTAALPAIIVCPGYAKDCEPTRRMRELAQLARNLCAIYGVEARFVVYSASADGAEQRVLRAPDIATIAPVRLGRVMLAGPIERLEGTPSLAALGRAHDFSSDP